VPPLYLAAVQMPVVIVPAVLNKSVAVEMRSAMVLQLPQLQARGLLG
jgi:hypothetical protein